jgi:hypothetical protein
MLLGIWLALCHKVLGLNTPSLGALVYIDEFTRDSIKELGEASLGFLARFSLKKNKNLKGKTSTLSKLLLKTKVRRLTLGMTIVQDC